MQDTKTTSDHQDKFKFIDAPLDGVAVSLTDFDSELGEIHLGTEKVWRDRNDSNEWSKILEEFDQKDLVDEVRFSNVEGLELHEGEIFPCIQFETEDGFGRMFLSGNDDVNSIFEKIKYQISVYRQNF